jgi:16S rRNA (adenine1518-N6/adenine1519-N6)-dimethyltransferase
MNGVSRHTRSELVELFRQQGVQPRHDLGQNFLIDLNLHDLLVREARLGPNDVVLEVGTGTGGLTGRLVAAAGAVVSVECDPHVHGHAQETLADTPHLQLLLEDALSSKHEIAPAVIDAVGRALKQVQAQLDIQPWGFAVKDTDPLVPPGPASPCDSAGSCDDPDWQPLPQQATLKLVANLPYQVATPIISNLIASDLPWSRMVVTVQWELAQRMLASPGTSDYSALTVWLQSQSTLKILRKLPPSVFWPPPKVDSAMVLIERDTQRAAAMIDRAFFHELVRHLFTQRRKSLAGVLTELCHHPEIIAPSNQTASDRRRSPARQTGRLASQSVIWPCWTRPEIERLLENSSLSKTVRAEQLTVAQLVTLANQLLAADRPATPSAGPRTTDDTSD